MFVLSLFAQEPEAPTPRAERADPVQRLRIIVEDEAGKRVPQARIFFASSELSVLDPQQAPEQLEFVADKRGRAIVSLDPRRDWSAWAVKSVGKKRWASPVQGRVLEAGILRLTLVPFPVPFLRISNLSGWKTLYPGKLSLVYVSLSLPYPRFRQSLPEGKDEVRELPPLPMNSYFPVLWHEDKGFLDTVYLAPAFHEGVTDAEVLYERDYPLKKCIFGRPLLLRGKVIGIGNKVVPRATLRCGPSSSIPCPLRQIVSADEKGRYELVVPFKPESRRTSYLSDVIVWAPGRQPVKHSVATLRKQFEINLQRDGDKAEWIFERDFALVPGRALAWKSSGKEKSDELFLLTQALQGGNPGTRLQTGIGVDGEGQLILPGIRPTGGLGALLAGKKQSTRNRAMFELYLRRGGLVFALTAREKGVVIPERSLDLSDQGALELLTRSASGRPLKRGYCEIKRVFSGSLAAVSTRFGLAPGKATRLQLPVGKYVMRISQKPLGAGYAAFEIQKGKDSEVVVSVEPYLRLRGKIVCEDEEVQIGGLPIQVYPQQIQKDRVPILARAWAQQYLQQSAAQSRADGSFELLVSPFVQRLSVQTYASVANRYLSAQVMIDPHKVKEVELTLR